MREGGIEPPASPSNSKSADGFRDKSGQAAPATGQKKTASATGRVQPAYNGAELGKLAALWPRLTAEAREKLLALARKLVGGGR